MKPLERIKAGELEFEEAVEKHFFITAVPMIDQTNFIKTQTKALIQSLIDELEEKKNSHCGKKDCSQGQCLTRKVKREVIQNTIDRYKELIDQIT